MRRIILVTAFKGRCVAAALGAILAVWELKKRERGFEFYIFSDIMINIAAPGLIIGGVIGFFKSSDQENQEKREKSKMNASP